MSCSVKGCKNVRRLLPPNSKISFLRFPREENRFRQWLNAIDRGTENRSWSRGIFICSAHFLPEDIEPGIHGPRLRPRLKESAVPYVGTPPPCESVKDPLSVDVKYEGETYEDSEQGLALGLSTSASQSKRKTDDPSSSGANSDDGLEPQSCKRFKSDQGSGQGTSSGSDSDSNLTKRLNVKLDHPYGTSHEAVLQKSDEIKEKLRSKSRELYEANKKIRSLKKRVDSLKEIVADLKSDNESMFMKLYCNGCTCSSQSLVPCEESDTEQN